MKTAKELGLERGERDRGFSAESAALHSLLDPKPVDLPEGSAEETARLIDEITEAFTPRGSVNLKKLIQKVNRAVGDGVFGPRLRDRFAEVINSLEEAGPGDIARIERRAAAIVDWGEREFGLQLPPGSGVINHGENKGALGTVVTRKFSGGGKEVVHRTPEEVAELEAQRQQEAAAADAPLGTPDKRGTFTITPADVTAAFAADPGKGSAKWLELDEAERETLLRGHDVTGVKPQERK